MRFTTVFIVVLSMFSCAEPVHEPDGFITSAGGEESISQDTIASDASKYDLEKQPEIIQQFFALTDEQIGDDYCFDRPAVADLIIGELEDEFVWTSKQVNEHYLRFENSECFVTTEFQIIEMGDETMAVLFQSSKNGQQRDFWTWSEDAQAWQELSETPQLEMYDFYHYLNEEEQVWVKDFGAYYGYINEQTGQISYHFSTWQMGLNADGKEIMDFDQAPDYSYVLNLDDSSGFWLQKIYENKSLTPKRYFSVFSTVGGFTDEMKMQYEEIQRQLSENYQMESALSDLRQSDGKFFFTSDTIAIDGSLGETNGLWFFEQGKEPLILRDTENSAVVEKAKRYFDSFKQKKS